MRPCPSSIQIITIAISANITIVVLFSDTNIINSIIVISITATSQGLTCLNCASTNPVLRLARYLEGALCKAAASRLAMPFMRPLLPSQTQDANCFRQSDSSLPLCSDPLILPSAPSSSSSSSSSSKATHNSSTSGEEGEETANSNTKQRTDLTRNNNAAKGSSEEIEERRKNEAHTQPEDLLHVLEKV